LVLKFPTGHIDNRELVALLQKDGFHTISEAVGADYKKRAKKSTKSSQKPLQKM
jgi:hypothetical protein